MKKLSFVVVLLVGFLAACGSAPGPGGMPVGNTPRTALPSELVGGWYTGSVSAIDYYDPTTGSWAPPSGSGFAYTFYPDGTYEQSGLVQVTTYNCTSSLFGYFVGTVTVEGDVLTTYQNNGKVKHETNCGESSENPAEPEVSAFRWQIGPDEYGDETLWLTWPDGEVEEYRRLE